MSGSYCGIDIVPAPEACHITLHIRLHIEQRVNLTIDYLHLGGLECETSYFAIYETPDLQEDSTIKFFRCIKIPIHKRHYLADWNTMSVVFHRHAAQSPGLDLAPPIAVLAVYRGTPLERHDNDQGKTVVVIVTGPSHLIQWQVGAWMCANAFPPTSVLDN